jgi:hypothetical protein
VKPLYPGSFVGQRWSRPGQAGMRPVAWQDKETRERRYGRVQGKPAAVEEVVWDGGEWVKPDEFLARMRRRLAGKVPA